MDEGEGKGGQGTCRDWAAFAGIEQHQQGLGGIGAHSKVDTEM